MKQLLAVAMMLVMSCYDMHAKDVVFPNSPTTPVPPTTEINTLNADQLYVITSDKPVTVLASPQGVVSVSTDTGPVKIKAKFVDGSGKVETRAYKAPFVYSVEAITSGKVELLIIGQDGTVIRKNLQVGEPSPAPAPANTFATKLKSAYAANPDPGSLSKLITILEEVAGQDYNTVDQMASVLSTTGKRYLPNNELRSVRDTISQEIVARGSTVQNVKAVLNEAVLALR